MKRAIDERYRATIVAHWRSATLFPIATFFYAHRRLGHRGAGRARSVPSGDSRSAASRAFIFLSDVFLHVFTDLPEIYADTQTAIAGWRKILTVLDLPIEIVEPDRGVELPAGPIAVRTTELSYSYREGGPVLRGISVDVERRHARRDRRPDRRREDHVREAAGAARRPGVAGTSRWAGGPARACRRRRDATRSAWFRRTGSCSTRRCARTCGTADRSASDRDVETAFDELGLADWVDALPQGLDTPVGERGEALSVGERQLVSLAAGTIDQPGLLILTRPRARWTRPPSSAPRRRCGGSRPDGP